MTGTRSIHEISEMAAGHRSDEWLDLEAGDAIDITRDVQEPGGSA